MSAPTRDPTLRPAHLVRGPLVPLVEVDGFDAQVRAVLHNLDHRHEETRCVDPVVGPLVHASPESRSTQWFNEQEEALRRARIRVPLGGLYRLDRPPSAPLDGGPPFLLAVVVSYRFVKGVVLLGLLLIGLPPKVHGSQLSGAAANPLLVPVDADLVDISMQARAAYNNGGEDAKKWHRFVYPYRAWLAQLGPFSAR